MCRERQRGWDEGLRRLDTIVYLRARDINVHRERVGRGRGRGWEDQIKFFIYDGNKYISFIFIFFIFFTSNPRPYKGLLKIQVYMYTFCKLHTGTHMEVSEMYTSNIIWERGGEMDIQDVFVAYSWCRSCEGGKRELSIWGEKLVTFNKKKKKT